MLQEKPFGEPIIQDDASHNPPSETEWGMSGTQMRQQYGGTGVPAGGPGKGQTHVLFADAQLPDAPPAGPDAESRITKGDEETSGYYRS